MKLRLKVKEKTKVPKGVTNEDAKLIDRVRNIFIIADGIGGHPAGGETGKLAVVDAYHAFMGYEPYIKNGRIKPNEIGDYMAEAIKQANETIYGLSSSVDRFRNGEKRAGTTMLFGYFFNDYFYFGNVGDSRAYLLRGRRFTRLTQDDSSIDNSLDEGTQKLQALQGLGVIQKYVGQNKEIEPAINRVKLHKNDIILMTTDGLTKLLFDDEISNILYGTPFEQSTTKLARAVDNPRKLIGYHAKLKGISPKEARKELKNRDSLTFIALKPYRVK